MGEVDGMFSDQSGMLFERANMHELVQGVQGSVLTGDDALERGAGLSTDLSAQMMWGRPGFGSCFLSISALILTFAGAVDIGV